MLFSITLSVIPSSPKAATAAVELPAFPIAFITLELTDINVSATALPV